MIKNFTIFVMNKNYKNEINKEHKFLLLLYLEGVLPYSVRLLGSVALVSVHI